MPPCPQLVATAAATCTAATSRTAATSAAVYPREFWNIG